MLKRMDIFLLGFAVSCLVFTVILVILLQPMRSVTVTFKTMSEVEAFDGMLHIDNPISLHWNDDGTYTLWYAERTFYGLRSRKEHK